MDSADIEFNNEAEEKDWNERGEFWNSLYEKYQTGIASRMGLVYEFFTHDDIWDFGHKLREEYEKQTKKGK